MDCRFAQQELSGGSETTPEVQRHLESCDGCRQFAEDLRVFRTLGESTVTTPPVLRERTFDRCRVMLVDNTAARRETLWQRCRRIMDSPQFVLAAATLGILIVATIAVLQIDKAQDRDASILIRVTIFQIVIQNFVAALFLPALLFLKDRFRARHPHAAELGV